jgi:hypothetical protein
LDVEIGLQQPNDGTTSLALTFVILSEAKGLIFPQLVIVSGMGNLRMQVIRELKPPIPAMQSPSSQGVLPAIPRCFPAVEGFFQN